MFFGWEWSRIYNDGSKTTLLPLELCNMNIFITLLALVIDKKFLNNYYMLYGKEISYFTVFKIIEHCLFNYEVIDVIKNVGTVKAIDLTEAADAIEIWVKDIHQDLLTCMYLFPYDGGIVRIK